jgi:hypothetical protein
MNIFTGLYHSGSQLCTHLKCFRKESRNLSSSVLVNYNFRFVGQVQGQAADGYVTDNLMVMSQITYLP